MQPSSRTPEGWANRCPICGHRITANPSLPPGDAPCPHCGHLLWFDPRGGRRHKSNRSERTEMQFEHALLQMRNGAYDYAIVLLLCVVRDKPGEVRYRKALRQAEYLKHNHNRRGDPMFCLSVDLLKKRLVAARKQGDWAAVDREAEEGLTFNPWEGELLIQLGNACRQRGLRESAIHAYQCALDVLPDNAEVRRAIEELGGA